MKNAMQRFSGNGQMARRRYEKQDEFVRGALAFQSGRKKRSLIVG
jgi:hypothetical protein